jgi:hypothetical protein
MRRGTTFRSRTAFVSLAVVALAFAGCGSTQNAATSTVGGPHAVPPPAPVVSATYSINLSGANGGAPNGSGVAVFGINPSTEELCWTFSLTNVSAPTIMQIVRQVRRSPPTWAQTRYGRTLGGTYKPSGCVPLSPNFLRLIEAHPQEWWIEIHSAHFRHGAVRAPL